MSDFPRMLYREGASRKIWGRQRDTLLVHSEEEQDAALDEGWALRPDFGDSPPKKPEKANAAAG